MDNIISKMVNMPTTIKSYVVCTADNDFCIVLNANHSFETLMEAYQHELKHIRNGDYDKKGDIDFIEINTHYN